jgi:hypothetical protein
MYFRAELAVVYLCLVRPRDTLVARIGRDRQDASDVVIPLLSDNGGVITSPILEVHDFTMTILIFNFPSFFPMKRTSWDQLSCHNTILSPCAR